VSAIDWREGKWAFSSRANALRKTLSGAKQPKSMVVPAQSNTAAFRCDMDTLPKIGIFSKKLDSALIIAEAE
jgi:hypothetical protein